MPGNHYCFLCKDPSKDKNGVIVKSMFTVGKHIKALPDYQSGFHKHRPDVEIGSIKEVIFISLLCCQNRIFENKNLFFFISTLHVIYV